MKKISLAQNSLVVLCGPAGSGKSYFAQKYFRPSQIVSSDACREIISDNPMNQAVSPDAFELMYQIIGYRLKYNRLVVADATHLLPSYRTPLLKLAKEFDRPIFLILFETSLEECLRNNASRMHQVPADIVGSQVEKFSRVREQISAEPYTGVISLRSEEVAGVEIELGE